MAKGYVFRGQGLGVVTDKVYLQWPSKSDFDEVMQRELSLHGFSINGDEVAVTKRWIRVQEVELVGLQDVLDAEPAPGQLNEFVYGELDEASLREILAGPREPTGATPLIEMNGTGSVTNPGEPGYNPDL